MPGIDSSFIRYPGSDTTLVFTGYNSISSRSLSFSSRALADELLFREFDSSFICLIAVGVCITGSGGGWGTMVIGTGLTYWSLASNLDGYL